MLFSKTNRRWLFVFRKSTIVCFEKWLKFAERCEVGGVLTHIRLINWGFCSLKKKIKWANGEAKKNKEEWLPWRKGKIRNGNENIFVYKVSNRGQHNSCPLKYPKESQVLSLSNPSCLLSPSYYSIEQM